VYLFGSPLIVPLFYARIAHNTLGKRTNRLEFLLASPLLLLYLSVWAFGEGIGYAIGGGRSILKVR
jgi:hypothetical protein